MRAYLAALHHRTESGRQVNEAHSDLTDRLIRRLYSVAEDLHLKQGGAIETGVTLIAVGGYARREMSIHSDVDLLILYRDGLTPFVEFLAERLQYWLWDAGVTVGCATRTIDETVQLGREDVTVRTTVLMPRYLCGDGEFFHHFADRILGELLPNPWDFVQEQQRLIRERQLSYGDTLFLLQPNVKEGAGGLRDYHAAYWVARGVQTSIRNVDDLLHFGLLTEPEMNEYRDALDFLWRTRNELHLRSGRANEQMSFELQESVSEGLGYGSMKEALAAEQNAPSADESASRIFSRTTRIFPWSASCGTTIATHERSNPIRIWSSICVPSASRRPRNSLHRPGRSSRASCSWGINSRSPMRGICAKSRCGFWKPSPLARPMAWAFLGWPSGSFANSCR